MYNPFALVVFVRISVPTDKQLLVLCEISSSHGREHDVIPDDGGSTHLWNVGRQSFYTVVYPRRQFWTITGSVRLAHFFY
jgi:hypothetical protein